jgi:hypothetical protein
VIDVRAFASRDWRDADLNRPGFQGGPLG